MADYDTPDEQPSSGLSAIGTTPAFKPGSGKNLGSFSSTPGAIMSEDASKGILDNMQKMLDEYNSPYNKFQKGIDRAIAYTHYDPTAALHEANEQEQQEQANKYTLSQNMASIKAQQDQSKAFQQFMNQPQGAAGTPGMPGIGGTAGASIPGIPANQQRYAQWLQMTNPPEFQKLLTQYNIKRPDQLKITDEVRGMEDTPQNRALLMDLRPELFKGKEVVDPATGRTHTVMPDIGAVFKQATTIPTNPTTGGNINDAEAWAKANGIPLSPHGGNRTFNDQIDQFTQNPNLAAAPGTSPHEQKRALDIPSQYRTPEVKAKLAAAGFKESSTEPWHFELPAMRAQIQAQASAAPVVPTTPALAPAAPVDTSKEGVATSVKAEQDANKSINDKVYEDLAAKPNVDNRLRSTALNNNALNALDVAEKKGYKTGPGTSIRSTYLQGKIAAGLGDAADQEEYAGHQAVELAKQSGVALGAKAALGSAYTQSESKNFSKTLASIDDPVKQARAILQLNNAMNMIDEARLKHLSSNKTRMAAANEEFDNKKIAQKILRDNVDFIRENEDKVVGKSEVVHSDDSAEKWLKENPNHPDAEKVRKTLERKKKQNG